MNFKLIEINNIKFDIEPTTTFYLPSTIVDNDELIIATVRSWITDMLLIDFSVCGVTELPDKMVTALVKQPYDEKLVTDLLKHFTSDQHTPQEANNPGMTAVSITVDYPTEVYALIPSYYTNISLSAYEWIEQYLQIKITINK